MNPDKRAADIPYAAMDPFISLDRFCKDRERSLARIRQLSPGDLARRAIHSEIEEITLAGLRAMAARLQPARTATRGLTPSADSLLGSSVALAWGLVVRTGWPAGIFR